ncbi:hypothetical protein KCP77_20305 [Salmonella enterica subsp. enterica]|nr:hypothetical protein KCP77_20305 [Salmonella enterica subsp. enterica]
MGKDFKHHAPANFFITAAVTAAISRHSIRNKGLQTSIANLRCRFKFALPAQQNCFDEFHSGRQAGAIVSYHKRSITKVNILLIEVRRFSSNFFSLTFCNVRRRVV